MYLGLLLKLLLYIYLLKTINSNLGSNEPAQYLVGGWGHMGHILILLASPLVDHCSFDMGCLVCDLEYCTIILWQ